MKSSLALAVMMFAAISASAQAAKPCEELKAEIAKKLEAKGVKSYTLEIVDKDKEKEAEGKVVGSCEGGTKQIVYRRTATPSQAPAPETPKP